MSEIKKNIFRYPGGKFQAIKYIKPFWEEISHDEYREPFVGGGSVFIKKNAVDKNWINDIDKDLIAFYKTIQSSTKINIFIKKLLNLEVNKKNYDKYFTSKPTNDIDKAVRFYFLNRCSFSGIVKWNAYIGSPRWNIHTNKDTIIKVGIKLKNYKITSFDFEKVISAPSKNRVFMFIDPPYAESRQVAAYNYPFDKEDHIRLNEVLKYTKYKFLLTYDDCEFIRKLYKDFYFFNRSWKYSVANSKVHHNPREDGNELFITNFKPTFILK